jgi:hypothetical protein
VNALTGYRILGFAGLVLALVMFILMKIGTTNEGLFYFWGVLLVAGVGVFGLAAKLDGAARARKVEEERRRRLSGQ